MAESTESVFHNGYNSLDDSAWLNPHPHTTTDQNIYPQFDAPSFRVPSDAGDPTSRCSGLGLMRPQRSALSIKTSNGHLALDPNTLSAASSFSSWDTAIQPCTPQSATLALKCLLDDGDGQAAAWGQAITGNGDEGQSLAMEDLTPRCDYQSTMSYNDGSMFLQDPSVGLTSSASGFESLTHLSAPIACCSPSISHGHLPCQQPMTSNLGLETQQSFLMQPPMASPALISNTNTPRVPSTNAKSFEPFLSPYNFHTPLRDSNDRDRRYSNPAFSSSPAFSYGSSQTPSIACSTPRTPFGYLGTPSSSLTSPEGASPGLPVQFGQYKSIQSPINQHRAAPYSLDRAQRQRWSTGQRMTMPGRIKPRLGHSLSESHVPQLPSFATPLPAMPYTGNHFTFPNLQSLAPVADLGSQHALSMDSSNSFIPQQQYNIQSAFPPVDNRPAEGAMWDGNSCIWPQPPSSMSIDPDPNPASTSAQVSEPFVDPNISTICNTITPPSSPPPEDMNPTDPHLTPFRDHPKCESDLYTPKWKRRTPEDSIQPKANEGWCGMCKPGRWLNMKNSRYWDDKWSNHGISAKTKRKIQDPVEVRVRVDRGALAKNGGARMMDGVGVMQGGMGAQGGSQLEGKCGECDEWVLLDSKRKRMLEWWRHASKDCQAVKRLGYGGADREFDGLGLM